MINNPCHAGLKICYHLAWAMARLVVSGLAFFAIRTSFTLIFGFRFATCPVGAIASALRLLTFLSFLDLPGLFGTRGTINMSVLPLSPSSAQVSSANGSRLDVPFLHNDNVGALLHGLLHPPLRLRLIPNISPDKRNAICHFHLSGI